MKEIKNIVSLKNGRKNIFEHVNINSILVVLLIAVNLKPYTNTFSMGLLLLLLFQIAWVIAGNEKRIVTKGFIFIALTFVLPLSLLLSCLGF